MPHDPRDVRYRTDENGDSWLVDTDGAFVHDASGNRVPGPAKPDLTSTFPTGQEMLEAVQAYVLIGADMETTLIRKGNPVFFRREEAQQWLEERLEGKVFLPTHPIPGVSQWVKGRVAKICLPHNWMYDTEPRAKGLYSLRFDCPFVEIPR